MLFQPDFTKRGAGPIPQMGNAGQTNSWTLTLPHGTYYWSVQAVDGGFVGSAFAAEQTLVFTNERPIAFTPLQREVLEDETCRSH